MASSLFRRSRPKHGSQSTELLTTSTFRSMSRSPPSSPRSPEQIWDEGVERVRERQRSRQSSRQSLHEEVMPSSPRSIPERSDTRFSDATLLDVISGYQREESFCSAATMSPPTSRSSTLRSPTPLDFSLFEETTRADSALSMERTGSANHLTTLRRQVGQGAAVQPLSPNQSVYSKREGRHLSVEIHPMTGARSFSRPRLVTTMAASNGNASEDDASQPRALSPESVMSDLSGPTRGASSFTSTLCNTTEEPSPDLEARPEPPPKDSLCVAHNNIKSTRAVHLQRKPLPPLPLGAMSNFYPAQRDMRHDSASSQDQQPSTAPSAELNSPVSLCASKGASSSTTTTTTTAAAAASSPPFPPSPSSDLYQASFALQETMKSAFDDDEGKSHAAAADAEGLMDKLGFLRRKKAPSRTFRAGLLGTGTAEGGGGRPDAASSSSSSSSSNSNSSREQRDEVVKSKRRGGLWRGCWKPGEE